MKIRLRSSTASMGRALLALALVAALWAQVVCSARAAATATQFDIFGPTGSGVFGASVTALPNGNIVVTDPL
jgi:hypothetical protein